MSAPHPFTSALCAYRPLGCPCCRARLTLWRGTDAEAPPSLDDGPLNLLESSMVTILKRLYVGEGADHLLFENKTMACRDCVLCSDLPISLLIWYWLRFLGLLPHLLLCLDVMQAHTQWQKKSIEKDLCKATHKKLEALDKLLTQLINTLKLVRPVPRHLGAADNVRSACTLHDVQSSCG
ncbi:hypothetical protein B0H17DRAFT_1193525 [Mycena rosella]|uniref:Uncharacterized protein n=1 Tax=Mycena rosella TaxID=1033263 RepID=A0AAD7GTU7_MYCRO|nr:hypothetical protein B0H17DRAFT_1193525 [Mycena rosella]